MVSKPFSSKPFSGRGEPRWASSLASSLLASCLLASSSAWGASLEILGQKRFGVSGAAGVFQASGCDTTGSYTQFLAAYRGNTLLAFPRSVAPSQSWSAVGGPCASLWSNGSPATASVDFSSASVFVPPPVTSTERMYADASPREAAAVTMHALPGQASFAVKQWTENRAEPVSTALIPQGLAGNVVRQVVALGSSAGIGGAVAMVPVAYNEALLVRLAQNGAELWRRQISIFAGSVREILPVLGGAHLALVGPTNIKVISAADGGLIYETPLFSGSYAAGIGSVHLRVTVGGVLLALSSSESSSHAVLTLDGGVYRRDEIAALAMESMGALSQDGKKVALVSSVYDSSNQARTRLRIFERDSLTSGFTLAYDELLALPSGYYGQSPQGVAFLAANRRVVLSTLLFEVSSGAPSAPDLLVYRDLGASWTRELALDVPGNAGQLLATGNALKFGVVSSQADGIRVLGLRVNP
jgi:hypothetical protein